MRFVKILVLILAAGLLASCTAGGPAPLDTPVPASAEPTQIPPTPTVTPLPPRELNVCIGLEPSTLYLYGGNSRAMWSVLEAVYDGPVDRVDFQDQPVILEDLPTLENGGLVVESVPVAHGQMVVDASGNLALLDRGVKVLPAECLDPSCAVEWDGLAPLTMAQVKMTFRIKPGITWSDGTPLTAADSVYSFHLASDEETPTDKRLTDRTVSYEAPDAQTVVWTGLPGFMTDDAGAFFWIPLPEHAWSQFSAADLLQAPESAQTPLGWGPYVIEEWRKGDSLTLRKNPAYFRAAEGLPYFDLLTFHFLGEQADSNLNALLSGTCDVLDDSVLLDDQLATLTEMQTEGKISLLTGLGPEWEQLNFGIRPADYDPGYNIYNVARPDLLGDLRVRQAAAYCIDRQKLIDGLLWGLSEVPAGFFPPGHPQYLADLTALPYDPAEGQRLLTEAGWIDHDGDPATPRQAFGPVNVFNGTELKLTYLTTPTRLRGAVAERAAMMLQECGFGIEVQTPPAGEFYAPGPQGPLFGRRFDLAGFSWQAGRDSPCFLFSTEQIPSQANNWLGVNITGYTSAEFDATCRAALQQDPRLAQSAAEAGKTVQQLFARDLPAIPLFYELHLGAARPEVCGAGLNASTRSDFWNLETLDKGETCP